MGDVGERKPVRQKKGQREEKRKSGKRVICRSEQVIERSQTNLPSSGWSGF